ncbi:hypothetical protein MXD62_18000 [Frankia sp. Mgl5]|nr:hypothetical protein [Frankia sp. Mgl5]
MGTTAIATGGASGFGLAVTEALATLGPRLSGRGPPSSTSRLGSSTPRSHPCEVGAGHGLRDPSNTQADIREAVADAGFPGLTSHPFGRKSVATLLEDGHSPRRSPTSSGTRTHR